jgi:hypothetical protein
MFGLFASKCPLTTYEKAWTEWRMRWLAEQFGIERLLKTTVLTPTPEFFPEAFNGTADDAEQMLELLCEQLDVSRDRIELNICDDVQMPGAAGHYVRGERSIIRVAYSQLSDPVRLIATIAHELAHEKLLGGELLTDDVADHEWVRTQYLRLDAAATQKKAYRYLKKTNDTIFHPDKPCMPRRQRSGASIAEEVRTGSASKRLTVLWDLAERPIYESGVVTAVGECLKERDSAVASAAGRTLAALGPIAGEALPQLVWALSSDCNETRGGAAFALGVLKKDPKQVVPELRRLLEADDRLVVQEAGQALQNYGADAAESAPELRRALQQAIIDCDFSRTAILARAMLAILANPETFLRDAYADGDAEMLKHALLAIDEQREAMAEERTRERYEPDEDF